MKRLIALALIAAPAFADQSLPERKAGGDWKGGCVERMERACRELKDRTCTVTAAPHERSNPGEPTAAAIIDAVTLSANAPAAYAVVEADGNHWADAQRPAYVILQRAVGDCLKMMKRK